MHPLQSMRLPGASGLLDLWDAGEQATPARRALLLVRSAWPDESALETRPLGFVNARLLRLRAALFGPTLAFLADCAACGAVAESSVPIDALLALGRDDGGETDDAIGGASVMLDLNDGTCVAVRVPCIGDLLALDATPGDAGAALLARIAAPATDAAASFAGPTAASLPPHARAQIEDWVSDADPLGFIQLALRCPVCAVTWREPLHVVDILWAELGHQAARVLCDVARLAHAFGWSEDDVLRMPALRRQRYLALLPS